jgi:RHS repeat-associated protein
MDNYYPFGLTFNSFKREGALENRIKFQRQERITDLGLVWDAFRYRNYMPEIGRFFNIDPLSDKYVYNSPYAFAENKLGLGIELEGLELLPFTLMSRAGWMTRVTRTMEKHHLIPRQFKLDKVVEQARKDGFKLEGKENKIELEKFSRKTGEGRHGNHPDYNKNVGEKLSEFGEKNPNPGPGEAGKFVKDLAKGLSETIKNNLKLRSMIYSNQMEQVQLFQDR